MTPEQLQMLVAMLVPIIDSIVKATPNPFDNLAWSMIRNILVKQNAQIAGELHREAVVKGMIPPTA